MAQDLLDMMMSAQDEVSGLGMTDSELVDQVITIMGAGHEVSYRHTIQKPASVFRGKEI